MNLTSYEAGGKHMPLPIRRGPVRFAVGSPNGPTSNSWCVWTTPAHNLYISCRDNFTETKVSLHASGRWRMGFTTEALKKYKELLLPDQNRAWEVWDEPPPSLPDTVIAFRLLFPRSELVVRPEQRKPKGWAKVIHLEAAPPGKITVVTAFLTLGEPSLQHESEPSLCLASFDIGNGRHAQLVVHGDPELDMAELIERSVSQVRAQAKARGIQIPVGACAYFLGRWTEGSRLLFCATVNRTAPP
jgi:hypothetical protein